MRFDHKPDPDAVHFEFRARQLQPKLQALRECLFALKEEAHGLCSQQWARSKKDTALADFSLLDVALGKVEDQLAEALYLIRDLGTLGRTDTAPGQSEQDL